MCLTTIVILATWLSAVEARESVQEQSAAVYIALGDSIPAGVGSSLPRTRGFAADVANRYEALFGTGALHENLAVAGETAESFVNDGQVERFRTVVADVTNSGAGIRAVSLSLGGNEMLALADRDRAQRQAGLEAFGPAFREALTAVRNEVGPETPIVVTTYYDLSDGDAHAEGTDAWWVAKFNESIKITADDLGAAVADVAPVFAGRVEDLTLDPIDVHPSNAGHRTIADVVWTTLEVDTAPPVVTAPDRVVATRSTPTLRFSAFDNGSVASVAVEADAVSISTPTETTVGEYVALVHLGDREQTRVSVTITVTDNAGNRAEHVVEIVSEASPEESP